MAPRLPARPIGSRRHAQNADSAGTLCGVNTEVETYIDQSERWPEEMAALRPILLSCGLGESIKWGKPCFGHEDRNIVIFQEMKGFLALMFFKGALLNDPAGVLVEQGPNSRSARRIEFRSAADVDRLADTVAAYVQEAIEVEQAGLKVDPAPRACPDRGTAESPGRRPGTRVCLQVAYAGKAAGVQPVLLGRQASQNPRRASRQVRPEDPGR